MSQVTPSKVLAEVSAAVPAACRENIVIIGSLAAGYHFFGDDESKAVRTKDVDCVLEPFHAAVGAGQSIARQLLDAGWQRRMQGDHQNPGNEETPVDQLPAVRLYPPEANPDSEEAWFIELLTVPESAEGNGKAWTRLPLAEGHFGLPTFRFLSITAFDPLPAGELGIRYARPEMMALANLLEHPEIKPDRMSSLFADRAIKRSNKDLGRVLAITTLADLDDYRPWAASWKKALEHCFPDEWRELASRAGSGLRQLMRSEADLDEAHHTCINGLLASQPPSTAALTAAGERLLGDAIETLEALAKT
jgi:hypothetical protein